MTHDLTALADKAKDVGTWLRGALDCKEWRWDPDQREAAEDAYKALHTALRAAAVQGEPVAWRCAGCGRVCDDPKADFEGIKSRGFISCCPERKMEPVSAPPAAGWDENKLQSIIERALLEDDDFCTRAAYQNIRQTIAHASANSIVEALRHNAPPDSAAGKSAMPETES